MHHFPEVRLTGQEISPEAELTNLVRALMALSVEQRDNLLQILQGSVSLQTVQAAVDAIPDLRSALNRLIAGDRASLENAHRLGKQVSTIPAAFQIDFQRAIEALLQYQWSNNVQALDEAIASWKHILHSPDFSRSELDFRLLALNNGGLAFHRRYVVWR
jgi:hypothetical protein